MQIHQIVLTFRLASLQKSWEHLRTSQNILRTSWEYPENIQEHLRTHLLYHLSIGFDCMQLHLIVLTFQLALLQISSWECHDHQL